MAKNVEMDVDANAYLDAEARRQHKGRLVGGEVVYVGALPNGMVGGGPSLVIGTEARDGSRQFHQMTMKQFLMAAKVMAAAFPDVVEAKMVFEAKDNRATLMAVPEGHTAVIGFVPTEPPPDPDKVN